MAGVDDVQIAGGVEHMQHIPMEAGFNPPFAMVPFPIATLDRHATARMIERHHTRP